MAGSPARLKLIALFKTFKSLSVQNVFGGSSKKMCNSFGFRRLERFERLEQLERDER